MRSRLSRIRMYADQELLSEQKINEIAEVMADFVLDASTSTDRRVADLSEQIIDKIMEVGEELYQYSGRRFSRKVYSDSKNEMVNIIKELVQTSLDRKATKLVDITAKVAVAPAVISLVALLVYAGVKGIQTGSASLDNLPGYGDVWDIIGVFKGFLASALILLGVGAFSEKIVRLLNSKRVELAEKAEVFFTTIQDDVELIEKIKKAHKSKDPKEIEEVVVELTKRLPKQ